jgi:hypothetical protein
VGTSSRGSAEGITEVARSAVVDTAFAWLCNRRMDYADSADAWNVRRGWQDLKPQLQDALLRGQYRFHPLRHRRLGDSGPHAMEPPARSSNGQRDAPGTAGGATPGQDVRRAD